ncbi:hypothetical protein [Paracraurococcus ruber]|uniref:Uncharacterized protein n=1 Tax=Paracraurococcus ruber TaxID=77675 RepID=A0ABS1CS27_9PROT|nr:hypothetical protein [Paracraurococcus ruber]MBK1656644.1 hypothetical protein [Paracraurococcus ruber]TDG33733.1 hypothetical protein E2C05_02635 [Paracraurococcus ruber]
MPEDEETGPAGNERAELDEGGLGVVLQRSWVPGREAEADILEITFPDGTRQFRPAFGAVAAPQGSHRCVRA